MNALVSGAHVLAHFDQVMQECFLPSGRVTCAEYTVAPAVTVIPVNEPPRIRKPHAAYTVVGSGKTGMDAINWLLDRPNYQPDIENFPRTMGATIAQMDALAAATSMDDLFGGLEQDGQLLRIGPSATPTTCRWATISQGELDCSASGLQTAPDVPVFDDDVVNLLMVRTCQPVFSGALIAWVESHLDADTDKNRLCRPVTGSWPCSRKPAQSRRQLPRASRRCWLPRRTAIDPRAWVRYRRPGHRAP